MPRPVAELVAALGHPEPDAAALALWAQALTHASAEGRPNYERLEYLGDAVLKLAVSEALYALAPERREGEMTEIRAEVVSDATLARVAERHGWASYLTLGPAEKRAGGTAKPAILASSLEAAFGAALLLYGRDRAVAWVLALLAPELAHGVAHAGEANAKARLQEWTQGRLKILPRYALEGESGPEHDRRYHVGVWVGTERLGLGNGPSKKAAEQDAARQALIALRARDGAESRRSSHA